MIKSAFLFTLLLFTVMISAQNIATDYPIAGLGEFRFGMDQKEVRATMELHASDNSTASVVTDNISMGTNLTLAGYVFDNCIFTFDENGLSIILFIKYFDKKNDNPKEFLELLEVLEADYGEQPDKSRERFSWRNETRALIMLYKYYDEKEKKYAVSVSCSGTAIDG